MGQAAVLLFTGLFHLSSLPSASANPPSYDVIHLGPVNFGSSGAAGLNDRQQVLYEDKLWVDGAVTPLPTGTSPSRIDFSLLNDAGEAVGLQYSFSGDALPDMVFRRPSGQTLVVTDLTPTDLNDRGAVVGDARGRAHLWDKGTLRPLGSLPGRQFSSAAGINNRDQVVGFSWGNPQDVGIDTPRRRGFLWQAGEMTPLGTWATTSPENTDIFPIDINDRGQILGRESNANTLATRMFLWEKGQYRELPPFPGDRDAECWAINEEGMVIGHSYDPVGNRLRPLVWKNGVAYDLNNRLPAGSGLSDLHPIALNDSGAILAWALRNGVYSYVLLLPSRSALVNLAIERVPPVPANNPGQYWINLGLYGTLRAIGTFSDGSVRDVTSFVQWTTSSTEVAGDFGKDGRFLAARPGVATVRAVYQELPLSGGPAYAVASPTISISTIQPSLRIVPAPATTGAEFKNEVRNSLISFRALGTSSDGTVNDVTNFVLWGSSWTSYLEPYPTVTDSFPAPAGTFLLKPVTFPSYANGVTGWASARHRGLSGVNSSYIHTAAFRFDAGTGLSSNFDTGATEWSGVANGGTWDRLDLGGTGRFCFTLTPASYVARPAGVTLLTGYAHTLSDTVQTRVRVPDDAAETVRAGVVCRYMNGAFYSAVLEKKGGARRVSIYRHSSVTSAPVLMQTGPFEWSANQWYTMRVSCSGNSIRVEVQGGNSGWTPVCAASGVDLPGGAAVLRPGLFCENTRAQFDDFHALRK